MTVVSIVFAILLTTLTLASMQFSPRILVSFSRDRTTQYTLGIFLGTFSYCIAAMPAARSLPVPVAPIATVAGAMGLALLCVGCLLFFIQHISQAISVNHIVDRIARETETVIDELMPHPRGVYATSRAAGDRDPRSGDPDPERDVRLHPLHRHPAPRGLRHHAPVPGPRHPQGRPVHTRGPSRC